MSASPTRRHIIAALLATGVAACAVTILLRAAEPQWKGIRLSAILAEADALWPELETMPLGLETILFRGPFSGPQKELQDALHEMGCQAFPILLQEIQASDSKIKTWVRTVSEKQNWIKLNIVQAEERRHRAWLAFKDLTSVGDFRMEHDRRWNGLLEFKPERRRDLVLRTVEVLQRHPTDRFIQAKLGWFLYMIAAESRPVIPYLREAAARGAPYADDALKRIREEELKDKFGFSSISLTNRSDGSYAGEATTEAGRTFTINAAEMPEMNKWWYEAVAQTNVLSSGGSRRF